jgi:hypothetical protein
MIKNFLCADCYFTIEKIWSEFNWRTSRIYIINFNIFIFIFIHFFKILRKPIRFEKRNVFLIYKYRFLSLFILLYIALILIYFFGLTINHQSNIQRRISYRICICHFQKQFSHDSFKFSTIRILIFFDAFFLFYLVVHFQSILNINICNNISPYNYEVIFYEIVHFIYFS